MTDPPTDSPSDNPPPSPPPSPLDQIVDDYAPRSDAVEQAVAELQAGHSFEEAAARLVEKGWAQTDVDEIIEEARVRTLAARGVLTRDQVLRNVNRRYQQSMSGGWFVGFPVWAAGIRLVYSLANLTFLRRARRRNSDDAGTPD